jgi:hypothetical protein
VNSFFGCAIAEVHAPIAAQGTGEWFWGKWSKHSSKIGLR